jgi:predicted Zn-dependent protease
MRSGAVLIIKPIEYWGDERGLAKIGDMLLTSLSPFLTQYSIQTSMKLSNLEDVVRAGQDYRQFPGYSTRHSLGERYGLPYRFDTLTNSQGFLLAERFILALDRYVFPGEVLFGITTIPAYYTLIENYVYGLGDRLQQQLAFVSVGYPEFGEINSESYLQRIFYHALHELGHAFGLDHHRLYPDKQKKYCPMAQVNVDFLTRKKMSQDDVICSRRNQFCTKCLNQLKTSMR